MKRIAAHIGLTTFCVLAVAFYLSDTVTLILMLSFAGAGILFFLIKKTRKKMVLPITALVAALACGVNLAYTAIAVKPVAERFCGENKTIEATLTDEEYRQYAKYCYRLTTDSIDEEEAHVKLLLKTDRPLELEPFDKIIFTADVAPTVNQYYLAKGYYITVNEIDFNYTVVQTDSKPLYYHAIRLRRLMRGAIERCLPDKEAQLCNAILIGDKFALDQEIKEEFRDIGASYFVVVSGMHFSVLCFLSLALFKWIFRKPWLYFPMTYLVIFLYMMITGFQPSVMRSGVMMLVLTTGKWLMRQSDPLTSLGIAGLAMPFIFSPYGCGDIGMILSFAATFSIIMWQTPIYNKLRIKKTPVHFIPRHLVRFLNVILSVISVCLAAEILILPLSVFLFNSFSLMTLLSSLLLYPLIWLIMGLSLGVCIFWYLGPLHFLAVLFSWPLHFVAKLTIWLVRTIASIPFAAIHVRSTYFYIWTAVTLMLGLSAYFLRKRHRLYPAVLLISAIIFFGGLILNTAVQLNINQLEFYAGKSGATVYLNYCGRIHLLRFDCDSSAAYQTMYRLTEEYGGVQSAVCTDYFERVNYNRMSDREFPVTNYLMYRNTEELYDLDSPDVLFGGNSTFILDDGVVLNTVEDNDKLLLYLIDGDRTVLLIPNGFQYDAIPSSMRQADVIILSKAGKSYDRLRCNTLIRLSSNDENLPQHKYGFTPGDSPLTFDLH